MKTKCTICGELFTYGDVLVGGGNDVARARKLVCGEFPTPTICEECHKLSHYERSSLRLLNKQITKKPHGYWREVEQIQGSLETIAEQLTKIASGDK